MNIEQPSYYLLLNMHSCKRIIAVNGFELERDFNGYSSNAEHPINHVIKNGDNYIELMVPSQEIVEDSWSDETVCKLEVRVRGKVDGQDVDYKVTDLVFSGDYNAPNSNLYKGSMSAGEYAFGDKELIEIKGAKDSITGNVTMLPSYIEGLDGVFRRSFTANVPFPKWAFFDGENLFDFYPKTKEKYKQAKVEMFPKLEELWDIFESKDFDKILPLFEYRSKEYDQAFYRDAGNTLAQLKNSIESVYRESHPLNRKPLKKMALLVSFDERLVTFVNAGKSNGTVMFYDPESNSNTFYNVYWMKKDGKWIIAR